MTFPSHSGGSWTGTPVMGVGLGHVPMQLTTTALKYKNESLAILGGKYGSRACWPVGARDKESARCCLLCLSPPPLPPSFSPSPPTLTLPKSEPTGLPLPSLANKLFLYQKPLRLGIKGCMVSTLLSLAPLSVLLHSGWGPCSPTTKYVVREEVEVEKSGS